MISLFTGLSALVLATTSMAQPFRSHDAVYVMKPDVTQLATGSEIDHAEGVLRYRFRNECDGWTVRHQSVLLMSLKSGRTASVVWEYASWEAKDGKKLKFHSRTQRNGADTEEIDGVAQTIGGKTRLSFQKPERKTMELPVAAYFPTSHLKKSLQLVEAGEQFFKAHYFDGSGVDEGFELDLVMIPFKGEALQQVQDVTLRQLPVWDMQLGFHRPDLYSSIPEFEIGARYRQDGVSTQLRQDYGDFVLTGDIAELSYVDEPQCK